MAVELSVDQAGPIWACTPTTDDDILLVASTTQHTIERAVLALRFGRPLA